MHVLFSQVPEEYKEEDTELVDAEGNQYYFGIAGSECVEEEFVIYDAAGRYVPFQQEALDSLIHALETYRASFLAELAEEIAEDLFDKPDTILFV